mgnify:FL=1
MMLLSEEQIKLKEQFRKFVDQEIVPKSSSQDRNEYLDEDMIHQLAKEGYLGAMIPKEYGGLGLDNVTIGMLNEEIGRGCSSVRSLLTVHGMVAIGIMRWGTAQQKSKWLPKMATGEVIGAFGLSEPNVGSDANGIETIAENNGDHYTLCGMKKWITMGQCADLYMVFAKVDGKSSAFLVEWKTKGFSREPINGLLGLRASMTGILEFNSCKIPRDNLIGSEGTGISHVVHSCLDYGRFTVAC